MLITIYSIIDKMDKSYLLNIYILTADNINIHIHNNYKRYVNKIEVINIKNIKKKLENFPISRFWNYIVYARILAPYLIKEKKIIYLDSDLLFMEDISKLWRINVDQYYVAAVKDSVLFYRNHIKSVFLKKLNFCFNASVMIMNSEKVLNDFKLNNFFEFIDHNKSKMILNEMDVLNVLLYKKVLFINPRWNVRYMLKIPKNISYTCYSENEYLNSFLAPYIVHFDGAMKPWHEDTFLDEHVKVYLSYMKIFKIKPTKLSAIEKFRRKILSNLYWSTKKIPEPFYNIITRLNLIKI